MQVQEFRIGHKREIKGRRWIVVKGCPRTMAVDGKSHTARWIRKWSRKIP